MKGRETEGVDVQTKPLHKKDAAIGNKQLVYSSNLIMEQEDAASFGDNEEVSHPHSFKSTTDFRSPPWTGEMPLSSPRPPTPPAMFPVSFSSFTSRVISKRLPRK